MKLNEILENSIENSISSPRSEIPSSKKAQLIRKTIRRKFALRRKLRDIAHRKNREYIEEPDVLDYMNGGVDNGPTFS